MKEKQDKIGVYTSVVKLQEHCSQLVIQPLDLKQDALGSSTLYPPALYHEKSLDPDELREKMEKK